MAASVDTASVDAVAAEWLADTDAPSVSVAIVQHGALEIGRAHV